MVLQTLVECNAQDIHYATLWRLLFVRKYDDTVGQFGERNKLYWESIEVGIFKIIVLELFYTSLTSGTIGAILPQPLHKWCQYKTEEILSTGVLFINNINLCEFLTNCPYTNTRNI